MQARAIRRRILNCFEQAAMPNISHAERERLLSFVVVGGGIKEKESRNKKDNMKKRERKK